MKLTNSHRNWLASFAPKARLALRIGSSALLVTAPLGLSAAELTASNALNQVRELMSFATSSPAFENRDTNFDKFRALLASLAASPQPAASTPGERALLRIAHSVSAHPERLDELLALYGEPENYLRRVARPPYLRPLHSSEDYRAAWESLLLAPVTGRVGLMYPTITQALSIIGNTNSIPVLELGFALTCEPPSDTHGAGVWQRQLNILSALVKFPTADSLRAVLRSLERDDAVIPVPGRAFTGAKDLRGVVEKSLGSPGIVNQAKWRQVLSTFPRDELSDRNREFLNRLARRVGTEGG